MQFLIANTSGRVNINLDTSGSYVDPYTGAAAYTPSESNMGRIGAEPSQIATNADPFTGTAAPQSGRLPLKGYTVFSTSLASDSVLSKLRELNNSVPSGTEIASDDEWNQIRALLDGSNPTADTVAAPAVQKILTQWPPESIFPILDAYRALLTTSQGKKAMLDAVRTIGPQPPEASLGASLEGVFRNPSTSNPTRIVALRLLANLFDTELIPTVVGPHLDYLLDLVTGTTQLTSVKGIAAAYTTLLMNAAVYLQKIPSASAATSRTLAGMACAVVGRSDAVVASSLTNALLVIGTLRRESLVKPSDIGSATPTIRQLAEGAADDECRRVAAEVLGYIV